MIMIIYALKVSGFCFILRCKAEPRGNGANNIFHFSFNIFRSQSYSNKSWYKKNTKIRILALKCLISDYFIDLQDFPWNDDAVEREWVCSKVNQTYCDKECCILRTRIILCIKLI